MGISTLRVLLRMGLQVLDSSPASLLVSRMFWGPGAWGISFLSFFFLSLNRWTLHGSSYDYDDDDTNYEYILYPSGSARVLVLWLCLLCFRNSAYNSDSL